MRALLPFLASVAAAQTFQYRGFLETRGTLYPQSAANDTGRAVGEAILRWEGSWQANSSVKFHGSFDARTDTHHQAERNVRLDWQDRSLRRPALSLRRASVVWNRGPITVEAGKQFIRWGKADILNPTDRFAPRDYLSVTDNDFLGVTAARVTVEKGGNTLDAVSAPRFTPSRTPLLSQRWAVLPAQLENIPLIDEGSRLPGRTQFGLRWNHVGRGWEHALVFYDGFHHLPLFNGELQPRPFALRFHRYHPHLRLYGGDLAVPLKWFTVKSETAWFTSKTTTADEFLLWVVQLERTHGEWVFVGGYAGETVTARRSPIGFMPDRGLARAFLGRAGYTIDPRRGLAFEAAIRQYGHGVWVKSEYSQELTSSLRLSASLTMIRGRDTDFLGQFHRNSHGLFAIRYSF